MHLLLIGGLGADKRVYEHLNFRMHQGIFLDWITPFEKEPIEEYAKRFYSHYKLANLSKATIVGLSFGGILSLELTKINPDFSVILISSFGTHQEFPWYFKAAQTFRMYRYVPNKLLIPPIGIAAYFFSTKNKKLLSAILNDTSPAFVKWAIGEIFCWRNNSSPAHSWRIHGTSDRLAPKYQEEWILIKNGGHFMVVDRADEVSNAIQKILSTISPA